MINGKEAYLKKLTASFDVSSVDVGKELDGSTPPSVFVGSWNYPKVYAGPMIAPEHGDTAVMDMPESWILGRKTQREIIGYRMRLVRGKRPIKVTDYHNPFVEKLQDITLSSGSIESEAEFDHAPRGVTFSDDHAPFGPSADIERFEVANVRWDPSLEKAYYDGDLKADDAVMDLHSKGLPFSSIQKSFSVGALGTEKRRRLVPTRWSITACDSIIGNRLLKEVRQYEPIETFRVHEFSSLNNYYAVIMTPTAWQYEWIEAFLHILGREELLFSDYETNSGKKGYSRVGGCYYSCKMAVLEALAREKRQAGAIVLREAYRGYVPLGVFNVRENVRAAVAQKSIEFEGIKEAMAHVFARLKLPSSRFVRESDLMKDVLKGTQTTLSRFV